MYNRPQGFQNAYQQGPPQGYQQGPPQGYQGPPQGYQQPPQGFQNAYHQGPPQGYQQGYQQPPPQGYQQGPPQGYRPPQGPPQGYQPPQGPPQGYRPPAGAPQGYQQQQQRPPQQQQQQRPPQQQQRPLQQSLAPPQQQQRPVSPGAYQHRAPAAQQTPQGYGAPVPLQTQHFGNQDYQYSQCTGKRKALLIGVNYIGTAQALRGCINDVQNIKRFLVERYGYAEGDIVVLTDDANQKARIPTKDNIIRGMQWLVKGAAPNDLLFFHYSGHGGLVEDLDGDEDDGYDQCIYPLDHETAGPLIDDDMNLIMVKPLPKGCRLTALYDSCHSGTALDLPFVYSTKGVVKEPNMYKDAGMGLLNLVMLYEKGDVMGAVKGLGNVFKRVTRGEAPRQQNIQNKGSAADVISLSGCKDDQTSADANEGGNATGAMSWAFISALTANPNQSYVSLLNAMRDLLSAKYSQKPQMSCSHPLDTNLQWVM